MSSDTLTLRLSGDVGLADFAKAVSKLDALVRALSDEIARDVPIDWDVSDLQHSSAITTAQGHAPDMSAVARVVAGYANVGRALESGSPIPYGRPVEDAARGIVSILNGRVQTIDFETADAEATVTTAPPTVIQPIDRWVYGAVAGRIQTLSNRGSLRFVLYDLAEDRAVSCYLQEGREDIMLDSWGKLATVEGLVRRDPRTGRPTSIRRITSVTLRREGQPTDYLTARGALPRNDAARAEDVIRQLRDG